MGCRMMSIFLLALALALALLGTGVAAIAGESSLSYGVLQRSCAPWDGPAMEMWLTTEPTQSKTISGPYVQIGIWRELPLHDGQVLKLGTNSKAGFASRCAKVGDCERAESATITFESYRQSSVATGRFQLRFEGGKDLNGAFYVKWRESHLLCR